MKQIQAKKAKSQHSMMNRKKHKLTKKKTKKTPMTKPDQVPLLLNGLIPNGLSTLGGTKQLLFTTQLLA